MLGFPVVGVGVGVLGFPGVFVLVGTSLSCCFVEGSAGVDPIFLVLNVIVPPIPSCFLANPVCTVPLFHSRRTSPFLDHTEE